MSETPEVEEVNNAVAPPQPATQRAAPVQVGKYSHVGQLREINEDSFFAFDAVMHSHRGEETFGLFIVADGMGGHESGEVASSLAAKIAASSILKDVYTPYLKDDQNTVPINEALTNAVARANSAVVKAVPDGGTTIVIALLMGSNAYIAHVGDSRAYVFKAGLLKPVTQDHSLSQKLQEMGQTAEEALQAQNVLYRAIGQGETVEADTKIQHLPPGSSLLLCSDGLWGMVDDAKIVEVLKSVPQPQNACYKLIDLANENGGRDNITAILVTMRAID
jgi:serine/threonine protein phosphatase PrpC